MLSFNGETMAGSVRLVDIAAKAGVSATVVSAVLRNDTSRIRVSQAKADEIRALADKLHYRPNASARSLKGKSSDVIGVLIGAESTSANYRRLLAIEQSAYHANKRLMIGQFRDSADRTEQYLQDFISRGIDSLVCFHNPAPILSKSSLALLGKISRVVFQTQALCPGAHCVDVNRALGVAQAVEYLIQNGRRSLVLVLNSEHDPLMQDRQRGFVAGHRKMRLPIRPGHIWYGSGEFPPSRELVDKAVEAAISAQADAVLASNDIWAIELIKNLMRRGLRVPQDIAVTGFDNLDAAALFSPALTTLDQNDAAFADAVMQILTGDRPDDAPPAKIVVPPCFVVRESA